MLLTNNNILKITQEMFHAVYFCSKHIPSARLFLYRNYGIYLKRFSIEAINNG